MSTTNLVILKFPFLMANFYSFCDQNFTSVTKDKMNIPKQLFKKKDTDTCSQVFGQDIQRNPEIIACQNVNLSGKVQKLFPGKPFFQGLLSMFDLWPFLSRYQILSEHSWFHDLQSQTD